VVDRPTETPAPFLTILTPCYNEEENVREVYARVKAAMATVPDCEYEHLFADNASTDRTVEILRELAAADRRVKVIVNTRNFGHIRSPYHAFLQARGDAVMGCVADLQDPPELIPQFVQKWREGYKVVIGVKQGSHESWLMSHTRRAYYWLVAKLSSDVELVHNFTGFGLYDREVVEKFRSTEEQYPYFRGLVSDFGYERAEIPYVQPARTRGHTKNDFFSLYDVAMLGVTNHSKVPLRLATMAGFAISVVSLFVAFGYLVAKLLFWDQLQLGLAPLLIGIYFFGAVQLFFIGMLGEYIGSIHTQVHKRPLVVEKERINFDARPDSSPQPRGRHRIADRLPPLVAVPTEVQAVAGRHGVDQHREIPEVVGLVVEGDSEHGHVRSNGVGAAD
jgi:glycosyltransferase involved in cell wall biosynthesis